MKTIERHAGDEAAISGVEVKTSLKARILKSLTPERHNQGNWSTWTTWEAAQALLSKYGCTNHFRVHREQADSSCGTAFCLAGHVAAAATKEEAEAGNGTASLRCGELAYGIGFSPAHIRNVAIGIIENAYGAGTALHLARIFDNALVPYEVVRQAILDLPGD